MAGLYKRALEFIKSISNREDTYDDLVDFETNSDISQDDQKDIIKSINSMVEKTKIKVTPDLFKIKANKRGIIFPLIINITAAVILICTVFGLYLFFQKSDADMLNASNVVDATSSRIIQQLKEQAQREKDRLNAEKAAIQGNLAAINADLEDLQANMDDRINSQVKDLREQLNAELEAERKRLQAAGVSQSDIERQLNLLRSEKDEELDKEIADIRANAEAERKKQEEELRTKQSEFNTALAQANENLASVENKYTAELASREQAISSARDKITELSQQREKFQLINDQIIGYYKLVQNDLGTNKLDTAMTHLDELNGYLAGPTVLSIPDIAKRYEVELFVIQSLKDLVTSEKSKTNTDSGSIIAQSSAITEIREHVLKADEAYRSGNKTSADQEYLKALELIPEINKSHTYFINQLKDIEAYRTSQVDKFLASARTAYKNKQYSDALVAYGSVLDYLPTSTGTSDIISQISTASANTAAATQSVNSSAAAQMLSQAKSQAAEKKWDDAITSYLNVISKYPNSTQVKEAVSGIDTALASMNSETIKEIGAAAAVSTPDVKAYKEEISSLKTKLSENEKKYSDLEIKSAETAAALQLMITKKQSEIASMESSINSEVEKNLSEISALEEQIKAKESTISKLDEDAKGEREQITVEIAAIKKTISEKENEINTLKKSNEEAIKKNETEIAAINASINTSSEYKAESTAVQNTRIKELEAASAELNKQVADLNKNVKERTAEIERLKDETTSLQKIIEKTEVSRNEAESKIEQLTKSYEMYLQAKEEYSKYIERESAVVKSGSLDELTIGKSYLDTFFTQKSVETIFPGLLERIKRYDQAFEQAGRISAITDMLEIIRALNNMPSKTQRAQYIDTKIRESDDELFIVLLRSLRDLVQK